MVSVSLAMIVRNNEGTIRECLESAVPWMDEVVIVNTGSTDDTMSIVFEICAYHGVDLKVIDYEDPAGHERWISNFADARNAGWRECTKDYILFLDSDDIFVSSLDGVVAPSAEGLKRALDAEVVPDVFNLRYDYAADEHGHVTQCQHRIRCVRNGMFQWVGPVHENLSPLRPGTINDDPFAEKFWVRHQSRGASRDSSERNVWITERWRDEGNKLSAHMWKGLGDAYRAMDRLADAIGAYTEVLAESADAEERYFAYIRRGDCYAHLQDVDSAMDDFQRAERTCPAYKMAYLAMAETLLDRGQFEQALVWCDKADMAAGDERSTFFNPFAGVSTPAKVRGLCYLEMGKYDEALTQYEKLVELYPDEEALKHRVASLYRVKRELLIYEGILALHEDLESEADRDTLVSVIPGFLRKFPVIAELCRPKRPTGRPTAAIVCGHTINRWGPSAIEEGVGGSEESAIYVSRELVGLGYHVEVYCNCPEGDMGVDEHGVVWLPYHAWTQDDAVDVFIGWRSTKIMGFGQKCKQKWLWLQDIPRAIEYTEDFCKTVDGIICISEFQASNLGEHGIKKAVISANGLEPSMFKDGPNHAQEFVYASSPDRGLEELLEMWPAIHERIPGSMLHVFYGFRDIYRQMEQYNPRATALRENIEGKLKSLPGIEVHGMVGQSELHRWFARCGFWLYPTSFEEAFCITAAKAQAMGAIPITSNFKGSSLPEVINYELGIHTERQMRDDPEAKKAYIERVVEASKANDKKLRAEMKAWARETFPWAKVAKQWHTLFSGQSALADHQPHLQEAEASAA